MVKLANAIGMETETPYSASQILTDHIYAEMMCEPLTDENGTIVRPVRRHSAPHFRVVGKHLTLNELAREPRSEDHDNVKSAIHKALTDSKRAIEFYTNKYEDGNPVEQRLFSLRAEHNFLWFEENAILFDDLVVIRPDLSGRNSSAFAPTGRRPAIVIEVVDTHLPEPETFGRLLRLSRMAHHIYFYSLVGQKSNLAHRFNSLVESQTRVRMRFTYALINGRLIKNGEELELEAKPGQSMCMEALAKLAVLTR